MNNSQEELFASGVKYHEAYNELKRNIMDVRGMAEGIDIVLLSPNSITNCLHAFRQAKQVLDKNPHPQYIKNLASLFLEFAEYRANAEILIRKEYESDDRCYKEMVELSDDIDKAIEEALSMLGG